MNILDFQIHEHYMREALTLAKEAEATADVPVGCVIVCDETIVGRGRNRREEKQSAIAHAEVEAITEACNSLGRWRLDDCKLYVTLEPCVMCSGSIINSKINSVYYGASEPKTGCCGSVLNLFQENLGHKPKIYGGILEKECLSLLKEFFQKLR